MARSERPVLGGGENLKVDAVAPKGGGAPYFPYSFGETVERLRPQAQELRQEAQQLDDTLRGERVIFESTLLPNFLANSHFPLELFREADVIPVGTRRTTAPYSTLKRAHGEQRDCPRFG